MSMKLHLKICLCFVILALTVFASACKSEARKYAGSYWENILLKMAEDAQKF